MCVCCMCAGAQGDQRRVFGFLELDFQVAVDSLPWCWEPESGAGFPGSHGQSAVVLETEVWFSGRARSLPHL